jgi:hypothetical protein
MIIRNLIRRVVQFIAFILFLIQLEQAIRKYFQYPVVVQTSRVQVENLQPPVVLVCQPDQFNYTTGDKYGYGGYTRLVKGQLHPKSRFISWKGRYGNQTYNGLENLLFDSVFEKLGKHYSLGIKPAINKMMSYNRTVERKVLFPHGDCRKMVDVPSKPTVGLRTKTEVTMYFVDPAKENDITTGETTHAQATIGPATNNLFERGVYEVHYSLHDATIHDGVTCTDYTKKGSTYGSCLMKVLTEEALQGFGCIPPWVPGNITDQACEEATHIDLDEWLQCAINFDLIELLGNREPEVFKKCLPPCTTMRIEFQKVLFKSNRRGRAFLQAKSTDWATVSTEVYSYDIFNLAVDLGSALGLWMGWSCISILDIILENFVSAKRYWK